jgi:hypothetical protein
MAPDAGFHPDAVQVVSNGKLKGASFGNLMSETLSCTVADQGMAVGAA